MLARPINDGPSGALVLHTVPTLVNTIPDPALQAQGTSTRGVMRAEASPLPTRSAIQSAVDQEIQDATAIADAALPETVRP